MALRAKSFREKPSQTSHYIINQAPRPIFGPFSGGLIASCLSIFVALISAYATHSFSEQAKNKELLRAEALRAAGDTISALKNCRRAVVKFKDGSELPNNFDIAAEKFSADMDECKTTLMERYFHVKRYFDDDMAAMLIKPEAPIHSSALNASDIFEMYDFTGKLIMSRHNALREAVHEPTPQNIFDTKRSEELANSLSLSIEEYIALIEQNTVTVMKGFDQRLTLLGQPRIKIMFKD